MTPRVETEQISLVGGEKPQRGTIQVSVFSKTDRAVRTIVASVICIGITLISLLIPIAHFVLVPLCLIISPFVILSTYRTQRKIKEGTGTCPYCDAKFVIFARDYKLPFSDVCEKCSRQVQIISPSLS